MADSRLSELREQLLRAGVAPRHAARAVLEIAEHLQQFTLDGVGRGVNELDAQAEAHTAIGSNEVLVQRYVVRPELIAWSYRSPVLAFALLPLSGYLMLLIATTLILCGINQHLSGQLHHITIAPQITHWIDLAERVIFLWIFPWLTLVSVAVLSYRHRAGLRWPLVGMIVVGVLAALINVGVIFTSGDSPGEVGAGIGISVQSLPGQLSHAAVLILTAFLPLWFVRRARIAEGHATPELRDRLRRLLIITLVLGLHGAVGWQLLRLPLPTKVYPAAGGLNLIVIPAPAIFASNAQRTPKSRHLRNGAPSARQEWNPPAAQGASPDTESDAIHPPIDWYAELSRSAQSSGVIDSSTHRRNFGHDFKAAPAKPSTFGWSQSRLHRVETLPQGGILVHLNDNCVLLLPFPYVACGIGKKPVNGDLFEHMHDPMQPGSATESK
jgi:hypothetical protein